MSATRCTLSWKAEALADGRLEGDDARSFELHASRCSDCRAEQKALVALHAEMRAVTAPALEPLARARKRASLLARANERFVTAPTAGRGGARWALASLAFACIVGAIAVVAGRRPGELVARPDPAELVLSPHYEVVESPHAIWRPHAVGATARIELADGTARFHVDPLRDGQHLVVALPDGELEILGAGCVVDVALGRTTSVHVDDGTVLFRRHDAPELALHAGEEWTPREAPEATLAPAAGAPLAAAPAATAFAPRASPGAARRAAPAHAGEPAASATARTRAAGAKFDEGISSFVHGSYALADAQLADFARRFPDDARCEDAAFLGAVARWRMGDAAGARSRAEGYLAAYPHGLRRAEAQHIVDASR